MIPHAKQPVPSGIVHRPHGASLTIVEIVGDQILPGGRIAAPGIRCFTHAKALAARRVGVNVEVSRRTRAWRCRRIWRTQDAASKVRGACRGDPPVERLGSGPGIGRAEEIKGCGWTGTRRAPEIARGSYAAEGEAIATARDGGKGTLRLRRAGARSSQI